MKLLPYSLFVFFFGNLVAQGDSQYWISTNAKIFEMQKRIKTKGTYAYVAISYQDQEGVYHKTRVRPTAIPIIGSLKSVDDTITAYYDHNIPMMAKLANDSFLTAYGWYILMVFGIPFGLRTINK